MIYHGDMIDGGRPNITEELYKGAAGQRARVCDLK